MADQMMAANMPQAIDGRSYGEIANPTPIQSENKIRRIEIQQLNYGYIVHVGCHSFAIEKPSDLVAKLSEYINAPLDTEKKWQEGKLL